MKPTQSLYINPSWLIHHAIESRLTASTGVSQSFHRCQTRVAVQVRRSHGNSGVVRRSSPRTFLPRCVWSTCMHLSLLRRNPHVCPDFTPVARNLPLLQNTGPLAETHLILYASTTFRVAALGPTNCWQLKTRRPVGTRSSNCWVIIICNDNNFQYIHTYIT